MSGCTLILTRTLTLMNACTLTSCLPLELKATNVLTQLSEEVKWI